MASMRFDVKCVKDCLVNNSIVYTVRSWQGYKELSKVEVEGVGLCTKKRIIRVTKKEDLAQYLSLSGFNSLDEWWAKVRSFGACEGWLFEVRIIPASPSIAPKDDVMIIAFTGHRHLKYEDVAPKLAELHKKYPGAIWVTGGAVGLDSHAAEYAMIHGIRLWLICPFPSAVMSARWNLAQKNLLLKSIKYAEKYSVLSPVFQMRTYQDRNIRMVQISKKLVS
jgi:hypothetical protein